MLQINLTATQTEGPTSGISQIIKPVTKKVLGCVSTIDKIAINYTPTTI